jgi:hypothetical protein
VGNAGERHFPTVSPVTLNSASLFVLGLTQFAMERVDVDCQEVQMMRRWKHGVLRCAVSVLVLALAGCDVSWVNVMIPDFQSKQVQGVWIWVSSNAAGTFAHSMQVPVPAQIVSPNGSAQWQTTLDASGQQQGVFLLAQPDPANPDGVTVKIGILSPYVSVSGYVKVSSYNVNGESPVSSAETSI